MKFFRVFVLIALVALGIGRSLGFAKMAE